jgi:hypothetical protein
MTETLEILVPVLAVAMLVLYLLLSGSRPGKNVESPINFSMDNLRPVHYQYFPLIRQAFSAADEEFLLQRVKPAVAREALRERRAVAIKFLTGLREDFTRLDHLARMVAALSPVLDRQQEFERLKLSVRFQVLYALVWTMLQTGNIPVRQFEHLSGLIGHFADQMERAVSSVNALSAEHLSFSPRP